MCGIAGYWLIKDDLSKEDIIRSMMHSMAHRGPDDFGFALFDTSCARSEEQKNHNHIHNLALSNVRLSIIDLSPAGHQPMYNDDKSICIVYNGEIFNYVELEEELKKKGHSFHSKSDTEVIIKAYEEWGFDCLKHFNGMWAFVIYDQKKNILFCARDRFGIKPFYYHKDDDLFVFGSEIKTLMNFPIPNIGINENKIMNSVIKGYRFVDGYKDTYYEGIEQLLPSEYLVISLKDRAFKFKRYWEIDFNKRTELADEESMIRRFRELLIDAVRIRLRSDVPYAFTLSGGMDSSSVVSIASKVLKKKTITFSAIYEKGNRYDEQEFITPTIDDLKVEHHFIRPERGNFFENLKMMIRFNDEPVPTVTFYSQWQVMKKIRESGYIVVLTGYAADEIVAGYYDHYLYYFHDLLKEGKTDLLKENVAGWLRNHNKEMEQWEDFMKNPDNKRFQSPNLEKYKPLFKKACLKRFNERMETDYSSSLLTNRMYNELMNECVPAVLRPEDRNSMMFSLESRVPFLDYRLVEYAYSLPNSMKIRSGLGKYVLREAMKGILNDKVRLRTEKVGFNAPFDDWIKNELKDDVQKLIDDPSLKIYHYIEQDVLKSFWDEHISGKYNHMMLFWNILNLEFWLRYAEDLIAKRKR